MIFKNLRVRIYHWRKRRERNRLVKKILHFAQIEKTEDPKKIEIYQHLKDYGLNVFPDKFVEKYTDMKVQVNMEDGFPFICENNKKLFFKQNWSGEKAGRYYKSLKIEQDEKSPHRYCEEGFEVAPDDILIDLGVAEGNFSFENIDRAKRFLIFEKEREWIAPLQKTFESFGDRVTIFQKYVSDLSDETHIKLDDIHVLYTEKLFIKIDVNGSERRVLNGMKGILKSNQRIRLVVCTYHKQNDFDEFSDFLRGFNFNLGTTEGYMIFYHDKEIKEPYLRKGVLRAWK